MSQEMLKFLIIGPKDFWAPTLSLKQALVWKRPQGTKWYCPILQS